MVLTKRDGVKMEDIKHSNLSVNGINMHVAEIGQGPAVLLLHGFPELWYMWRHQMLFLASRGYRAVAPDLRGFGDTDEAPPAAALGGYTSLHIVGDLVALLDALGVDQVLLVGHDFGAYHGWNLCLFRPERVKAFVALSIPFFPRHPSRKLVETWRAVLGDDYYICRFQKPGEAEEEFARVDTAAMLKRLFVLFSRPDPLIVPKEVGFSGSPDEPVVPPAWLSEDDINYYAGKFAKTGFPGGLGHYRALDATWELMAPWTGAEVKVPAKFVIGDMDLVYRMPGLKDYVDGGGLAKDVPQLKEVVIMKGVGHYNNEEKPAEINEHIIDFIQKF